MKKTLAQQLKKKFEKERKELLLRMEKITGAKDPNEGALPSWIDYGQKTDENAAEVAEFADEVSVQKSLHSRLQELDEALAKISQGTYGVCSECRNPIEEARIEAMPTATLCMNCTRKKK